MHDTENCTKKIKQLAKQFKAVAIIDPRQSGKTTLIRNRFPNLLSYLQQNLDEDQRRGKYIFTGSNNLFLFEKISQTLAGRVAYFELLPFSVDELSHISGALVLSKYF